MLFFQDFMFFIISMHPFLYIRRYFLKVSFSFLTISFFTQFNKLMIYIFIQKELINRISYNYNSFFLIILITFIFQHHLINFSHQWNQYLVTHAHFIIINFKENFDLQINFHDYKVYHSELKNKNCCFLLAFFISFLH